MTRPVKQGRSAGLVAWWATVVMVAGGGLLGLLGSLGVGGCMRVRLASEGFVGSLDEGEAAHALGTDEASAPGGGGGARDAWADAAAWPERVRVRVRGRGASDAGAMGLVRVVAGPLKPMSREAGAAERVLEEATADTTALAWGVRWQARWNARGAGGADLATTRFSIRSEGEGAYLMYSPGGASPERGDVRRESVYVRYVSGRAVRAHPEAPTEASDEPAAESAGAALSGFSGERIQFEPEPDVERSAAPEAGGEGEGSQVWTLRPEATTSLLLERTWMMYHPPEDGFEQPRGLAVVIPGLFGTPEGFVNGLVRRLRGEGWAVLQLAAEPSRFTQRREFVVDVDAPEAAAAEIREELDQRAAECAYAVQAGCAWVLRNRAEVRGVPRVLIGVSGGAMVGPTVIAREPEAYAGAVLIAGSGSWLRVAVESSYASWVDSLRFRWVRAGVRGGAGGGGGGGERGGVTPSRAEIDRLEAAYRACMVLDSEHTIRALRGKPLLMIHATGDRAVPAYLGDRLWRLAGKPERWEFDTGHELLFVALSLHEGRLMAWLRREVMARGGGAAGGAGGGAAGSAASPERHGE